MAAAAGRHAGSSSRLRSERARARPSLPASGQIRCVPVARALSGTGTRAPDRGARSRATIGLHTTHRLQHPAPPDPDAGAAVKIQEADAKSLLAAQGLPVPPWAVAPTPAPGRPAAEPFLADGARPDGTKEPVV